MNMVSVSGNGKTLSVDADTLEWRRFGVRGSTDGNCVEIAFFTYNGVKGNAAFRSSKNPGVILLFTDAEWDAFFEGVKDGEFG